MTVNALEVALIAIAIIAVAVAAFFVVKRYQESNRKIAHFLVVPPALVGVALQSHRFKGKRNFIINGENLSF